MDEFEAALGKNRKRSTFLTVLCVLTFIGSGSLVLQKLSFELLPAYLISTKGPEYPDEQEVWANDSPNDGSSSLHGSFFDAANHLINRELEYALPLVLIGIFSCLVSLGGALLMFNQKRIGYYLYIAAKVFGTIGTLWIYDFSGMVLFLLGGPMVALAIIFISLYGANLKHMR